MINDVRVMVAISMMSEMRKNLWREEGKYRLSLDFNEMKLFKGKRWCSEVIGVKNGKLILKLSNSDMNGGYNSLEGIMRKCGILDENVYLDVYEEYGKDYGI